VLARCDRSLLAKLFEWRKRKNNEWHHAEAAEERRGLSSS
jgi:hypothetical protein